MAGITNNKTLYYNILHSLKTDPAIARLENYHQHKGTTTLQHCWNVAIYSFHLAEKLNWKIDESALARGAMLHDYYLYTVEEEQKKTGMSDYQHGRMHPQIALENAGKKFVLTEKEKNLIRSHMWPLTFTHIPRSREAWLVSMADKYCAVREFYGTKKALDPAVHDPWIREIARRKMK